jgi:galactokinase
MAQQYRNTHNAASPVSGLDLQALKQVFEFSFGAPSKVGLSPRFFFAPGWVDVMGYPALNIGGWSLSLPVDRGVVVAAAPRADRLIQVRILMKGEIESLDLDDLSSVPSHHWMSTLVRVVRNLQIRNVALTGANLLISCNLPPGLALKDMMALEEALTLALYCLSGSDVLSSTALAMAGHAWLKNQDSQEVWPVPLGLPELSLVLCDSRVQTGLMETLGPQRVAETCYGLDLLRVVQPALQTLDDLDVDALQAGRCCLEDEIIRKRLRHCVSENTRVKPAAEALKTGNVELLGRLLAESTHSWRHDFELSCPEWDTLAALSQQQPGVVGARVLAGGDFEGCTMHWVQPSAMADFEAQVSEAYEAAFNCLPYISVVQSGAVAQELLLPSPVRV